jgi:type I restriction enzyme S subunit
VIEGLRPYEAKREAAMPWLDSIPCEWTERRIKYLFREIDERSGNGQGQLLSLTRARGLIPHADATHKIASAGDLSKYKVCRSGDLVMNRMQAWSGMFATSTYTGLVSPDYAVFRAKAGVVTAFFDRLFKTPMLVGEFARRSKGIGSGFNRLYTPDFGDIRVPLPPLNGQLDIIRFLDHVEGRLLRHLQQKRKLLALLNEQKQTIIHCAVTRGLDDGVRLKSSGVAWLGDIPEHWTVTRVKNEFRCLNNDRVPLSSTQRAAMMARTFDYYGASGVIDKVEKFLFDDDLLLIAEDGANLVLRNLPLAIIARGKCWVNNHAHILKPKNGNLDYLAALMETINYRPWISGAAQPKLTKDRLMGIKIALPARSEQDAIMAESGRLTEPIQRAMKQLRCEIEKLDEFRTTFIAAVVTGKLDVRDAAKNLRGEPDGEIGPNRIDVSDDRGLDFAEDEEPSELEYD